VPIVPVLTIEEVAQRPVSSKNREETACFSLFLRGKEEKRAVLACFFEEKRSRRVSQEAKEADIAGWWSWPGRVVSLPPYRPGYTSSSARRLEHR